MDYYVLSLRSSVAPDFMVVEPLQSRRSKSLDLVVEFSTKALESCPAFPELEAAIQKRFKDKRSRQTATDVDLLVVWCICSRDYQINGRSLPHIEERKISQVWEFITTLRTSSTSALSEWLTIHTQGRSAEGFASSAGTFREGSRTVPKDSMIRLTRGLKPVLAYEETPPHTIKSAMVRDTSALSLARQGANEPELKFVENLGLPQASGRQRKYPMT